LLAVIQSGIRIMSAEPLDWYKREQRRFLSATAGWSLENKGAYSVLIDLIMDQPRGLIDNDQWIAGQLGTSVRKWRIIKSFLISHDKIYIKDGIISNKKADKVKIIQRSFQDKQAENRRNPNKNKAYEPTMVAYREDKKITTNVVNTDTNVSVTNAREPLGDFEAFWKAWPNKVGKPAAVKSYQSAMKRGHSHEQVMEGLRRYVRGKPPDRSWLNPATFLNQERYNDEPAASYNTQANHTTINPDGSPSSETFGRTIPFPNKQGLGGRAGAALRSLQERAGMDWDR
jgi:hypothetical protein